MLLVRDKKEVCGAILTDLSKAFDCISHDLLVAKLHACGLDLNFPSFEIFLFSTNGTSLWVNFFGTWNCFKLNF